jgi:hypothetical protein
MKRMKGIQLKAARPQLSREGAALEGGEGGIELNKGYAMIDLRMSHQVHSKTRGSGGKGNLRVATDRGGLL